jgi:hypothetical protein
MLYIEKLLRASVIAMDAHSPAASGYLLREIPWQKLSAAEILEVIKLARSFPRKDFQ